MVALLLDRSPDLIAAVLGVLEAGAAYLPLNADQPEARLAYQVDDAGAKLRAQLRSGSRRWPPGWALRCWT